MDINVDDYKILNLSKDPFSTAPDPEFLYQSRQHFGTLQLLECAIKKQKGMSVVLGLPGTGKTTICRQLYRKVSFKQNVAAQVVYASYYENSDHLIREIANAYGFPDLNSSEDIYELFIRKYQEDGKTIALIVDNGHMIPEFCLSVLNRLSDLKSNGINFFKIVIFANKEFSANIEANPDFKSRIINYRILGPFNFRDTRQMIAYRLKMAGSAHSLSQSAKRKKIFSFPAMFAIYLATGGYPRKIVVLCHRCIVTMLLNKTIRAGWFLVRSNAKRVLRNRRLIPEPLLATTIIIIPLLIAALAIGFMNDKNFTDYIKAVNHVVGTLSVKPDANDTESLTSEKKKAEIVDDGESLILPELFIADAIEEKKPVLELSRMAEPVTEKAAIEIDEKKDLSVVQKQIPGEDKKPDLKTLIPENLGAVEVKRSDTLLAMLESVYGHSRKKYKTPVVEANQHISDIHSLEIGDRIIFPPIIADTSKNREEGLWVKIKSADSLNDAVSYKREWPFIKIRLKIIPYFTADKGLNFEIVHKKLYKDKNDAQVFIKKLPSSVKDVPAIIVFPINEAVFFANPYTM